MSDITIYHNPRCSKSRQTLALLEERGISPTVIEYLNTPVDAQGLKSLASKLGVEIRAMMRTKEDAYREQNLSEASDAELLEAIVRAPILLSDPSSCEVIAQ